METAAGRSLHDPVIIDDDTSDDNHTRLPTRFSRISDPTAKTRHPTDSALRRLGLQLSPLITEALKCLPDYVSSREKYHAEFLLLLSPGRNHDHLIAGFENPGWVPSSEQQRQIRHVLYRECEAISALAKQAEHDTSDSRRMSSQTRRDNASPDPLAITLNPRRSSPQHTSLNIQSGRIPAAVDEARRSGQNTNGSSQGYSPAPQHNGTSRRQHESTRPNEYTIRHETPVPLPAYASRSSLGGPVKSGERTPSTEVRPFPQNPARQSVGSLRPFPPTPQQANTARRHSEVAPARRLPQQMPSHRRQSAGEGISTRALVRQSQPHDRQVVDLTLSGSDSDLPPETSLMRAASSSASPAKRRRDKTPDVISVLPPKRRREGSSVHEKADTQPPLPASSPVLQSDDLDTLRSDSADPLPVASRHRRQVPRLESTSSESSRSGTPHIETRNSLPAYAPVTTLSIQSGVIKYKNAIHSRYKPAKPRALTDRKEGCAIQVSSARSNADVRTLSVARKLPKGIQLPNGIKTSFRLPPPKHRRGTWESQEERDELESAVRSLFDQKGTQGIEEYIERSTSRKHIPKLVQGTRRLVAIAQDTYEGVREREREVNKVLFRREIESATDHGRDDVAALHRFNSSNHFRKAAEDDMTVVSEYYGCAGDLWAGCWTSDTALICGTTTDGDPSSQQYNRRGNLLLCSLRSPDTPEEPFKSRAQAYADHRVARPIVAQGENSSSSMRNALEPWVYPTVTYTDYDAHLGLGFTSSYDHTVKVWRVGPDEQSMQCIATWQHEGRVNFVIAAKDGSGRVATGADVATDAVRVYEVDLENPQRSKYTSFSCSRMDADNETWSYFPSTMRWGISQQTKHLLLVGFSPRDQKATGEDSWIPKEKARTGELILWDSIRKQRVAVTGGGTANIFEVAWHPHLPRFYSATAPSADATVEHQKVRTQISVHEIDETGAYRHLQKLDCPAHDINELAILPNSPSHAYVAASCTNKRTYVWDSAAGDAPIRQLSHGKPITEYRNRAYERAHDEGTRFTAWGASPDRLYTGGTDGKVNVWDVRTSGEANVRTLFTAKAAVTFGAFSPDKRSLAIGDASGTLYLLSVQGESHLQTTQEILDFDKELPPPSLGQESRDRLTELKADVDEEYADFRDWHRSLIDQHVIVQHPNPTIGWVQGPSYHLRNWFRPDLHRDDDITMPLLAASQRVQRSEHDRTKTRNELCPRRRPTLPTQPTKTDLYKQHMHDSDIIAEMEDIELWMMMAEEDFKSSRLTFEIGSSDESLRDLARQGTVMTLEDGIADCELVEDDMYALE